MRRWHNGAISIYYDSDVITYGNQYTVFINNWQQGQFCVIDLNVHVRVEMKIKRLPVFWYYCRYGFCIIHLWSAIRGCARKRV